MFTEIAYTPPAEIKPSNPKPNKPQPSACALRYGHKRSPELARLGMAPEVLGPFDQESHLA